MQILSSLLEVAYLYDCKTQWYERNVQNCQTSFWEANLKTRWQKLFFIFVGRRDKK